MRTNAPIKSLNQAMLESIAEKLDDLCKEVVFLGGCTTGLLLTDPTIPDVRQTTDVDCIIDVISRLEYNQIENRLRKNGFNQSIEDKVICRWRFGKLILDIMPTDEKVLGFGNRWYKEACQFSRIHPLTEKININLITPPYFLATKLVAFKDRGQSDFMASHDLEDIITVLDGCIEIAEEVSKSSTSVKKYIASEFNTLVQSQQFLDALPGHLNYGSILHEREKIVLNRMKSIIESKDEL